MPKLQQMIAAKSKYLKKEDIEGEPTVTIKKIGRVNVAMEGEPEEKRWAVRFEEYDKPMVLNNTNLQLIARALGSDDTDDWIGKFIVLYVDDNVSFEGKLVGGIRIKPARARNPQPPREPGVDDDL